MTGCIKHCFWVFPALSERDTYGISCLQGKIKRKSEREKKEIISEGIKL